MKALVIIPTYNEIENIQNLVPEIFRHWKEASILVVDDNSPDGTGAKVKEMQQQFSQLHLLSRPGKQGLGKAYLAGFRWGIDQGYSHLIEMDADFSHRPLDLLSIRDALVENDFVVGSRYIPGGKTVNWGILRKIISRGGGLYSRLILGFPLRDWTGGFNGWRADVLEAIHLPTVTSEGYSFQIELKYKALLLGYRVKEVPITFEDRRVGQSKMSLKIVVEAFWRVWNLKFQAQEVLERVPQK